MHSLGSQAIVDRLFPNMEVPPSDGYNFALEFNCDQLPNPDKFLNDISEIKRHLFGGPLERAFNALQVRNMIELVFQFIPNISLL